MPEAISKVEGVTHAEVEDQLLDVQAALPGPKVEDEIATVARIADALKTERIQPSPASKIDITFTAPVVDRLGNDSTDKLMRLTFSLSDLRQANLERLSPNQQLDLASYVLPLGISGADALRQFCGGNFNTGDVDHVCAGPTAPG